LTTDCAKLVKEIEAYNMRLQQEEKILALLRQKRSQFAQDGKISK